jgi:proline iminopeptidase
MRIASIAITSLAGAAALALACGCSDSGTDGAAQPLPAELDFEGGDGTLLHAHSRGGPGEVVVVLHGGPGMAGSYLDGLLVDFAGSQRTVVRYDQRGVGESAVAVNDSYSTVDYVADLEALRVRLGVERIHIFGHSWGAYLAEAYVGAHPDHVASLSTYGGMAPTWAEVLEGEERFVARSAAVEEQGLLVTGLEPYFNDPSFAIPPELLVETNQEVYDATVTAVVDYDLHPALEQLDAPSLVLVGAGDPYGVEWSESTVAAIGGGGSASVIPACGHFWQECPDGFAERWGAFLDEVAPAE